MNPVTKPPFQISHGRLRGVTAAIVALFVVYLPLAFWLDASYVRDPNYPPSSAGTNVRINPSEMIAQGPFAATIRDNVGMFESVGDAGEVSNVSPVLMFENSKQLGPAHSSVADIVDKGQGRYRHYRGSGRGAWITWSSSDNSNPMTNGRTYWVVKPY
jgi:hypothetical protein